LLEKAKREPENGRPHELLADMENHIAREHMSYASEYAKEALRRDPGMRNAYGELTFAMHGKIADWNGASHYALIDFFAQYISEHPTCRNAHLDIIDQLLDDYRIAEAKDYCDRLAVIDQSYRVDLYRGKIAWQEGKRTEAFTIWEEMERKFPEEWCVYHNIGDYLLRDGQSHRVAAYYRKAIDVQNAPRYTDPFDALAQFYERIGDFKAAIAVLREQLEIFEKEWHFTDGETADIVRREILRLERKMEI
jgi:tetratricopeptide (TPR) repeat protein